MEIVENHNSLMNLVKDTAIGIKSNTIDIDYNDVVNDAKNYGINVSCVEDFSRIQHDYVFIEKLSERYVSTAKFYSALSGVTAGFGGIATAVTLAGVDLVNMAAQLHRLNQRLALVHGFDPENTAHQERSLLIYLTALGIDVAVNSTIRGLVTQAAKESVGKKGPANSAMIRLLLEVVKLLGLKMTKKQAVKIIPFVGAVLGGGINYMAAQSMARNMLQEYKSDYRDRAIISQG